jgi:ligand-binding SRPBCC domain-containing protein
MLRDEVEYLPPLGAIGRWLGGWFIRRKLERMFAFRHETTRRMIEDRGHSPS